MMTNPLRYRCLLIACLTTPTALLWAGGTPPPAGKFPPIVNTQNPKDVPPTPLESLKKITVTPGFHVSLFAGEPDVQQPIAMSLDDRGRLWVAECYTYGGGGNTWVTDHRDRVLIFEDDGKGRFARRTVFWDQARNLSGVTTGFGGVWLLCAPQLLFIPDGGDRKPEVVLDGWAVKGVGHNIVSGLTWGPDGWLYGRHGIMTTSRVGRPGTPDDQRQRINCGIWRYHPTRKVFEVVAHGTTNPWGLDYDDNGELFFTNNVIGHLWHLIPGAHYRRMYGEDFNARTYALIDQHADHYHWDTGKSWTDSRDAKGKNDELGGGHSHCGGMIYLGDNWPAAYRNTLFMCNTHGHRVNNDRLVRSGSGYVGLHCPDFMYANDPWFRGTELRYGPDGGVYVSDWTDLGECHDNDGVHRTSGRIYKITHGQPKALAVPDVAKLGNDEFVRLQLHKNDWYVRAARRNLQERAAAGQDLTAARAGLRRMFDEQPDMTRKLRALWALHVTGGAGEPWLLQLLQHEDEHVRAWAVRLLTDDGKVSDAAEKQFVRRAKDDPSGLVRLYLASALQRLPVTRRGDLAAALVDHGEDATDHNLPLMIWYGVEPLVAAEPARAAELAGKSRIPLVRRFIARRLAEDLEKAPAPVERLLQLAAASSAPAVHQDVLGGMAEALRGWRKARPPAGWAAVQAKLAASPNRQVRDLVRELAVVFGDGRALDELRRLVQDGNADGEARRSALRVLLDSRPPDLLPLLQKLMGDRATAGLAVRGLAAFDNPATPALILRHYHQLQPAERAEAVGTLTSRPTYARALLQAVAAGTVPRSDVSAFHARQVRSLGDPVLNKELVRVWGEVRTTPADKKQLMARYKAALTAEHLAKAELPQGRLIFNKTCASCHKLYGEGQTIAPDLTGSNRDNLDYLLENIVDPSAVVPADYLMSVVALKNGRVLTGIVGEKTERTLVVQTQTERVKLDRADVEEVRATTISLMPDGLLASLNDAQVRDLIAYLMARRQVPLPAETPK